MNRRNANALAGHWRSCLIAAMSMLTCAPGFAHHQPPRQGSSIGVPIPAIAHGEMLVVAGYRAKILDLAEREPRTDPTLRRLAAFVSLQHFACFWGLVPGSLSDEASPFNECSHADLAGARALLAHMVAMPGDQSESKALEAQIAQDIASDPAAGQLCSNSREAFDSGIIVWPDWQLVPAHPRTALTFLAVAFFATGGLWGVLWLALSSGRDRATSTERIE